ncbi:uncharacterized protein LOC143824581 [Paroedura picta]|uniref:uncharacterized protein LOC143824581 n=1 Tax=Paroedura picta TaxID=143630 RepID=UPI0040574F6B
MLGKTASAPMSIPQRQRQEGFYCPPGYQSEYTLFHTSRIIKYVFLDGSQNIVPSHVSPSFESQGSYLEPPKGYYYPLVIPDHSLASSYWIPDPGRLPIFVTLSKSQEKASGGWGQPPVPQDRLPVFRQLCGEAAMSYTRGSKGVQGPRIIDSELGKVEEQGLDKPMAREMEEEDEEEASNCMPLITLREREAKP